jgi:hypothetical protein
MSPALFPGAEPSDESPHARYTDKSRQYLRLAVENYKRAGAAESPELKAKFVEIAERYRDLALQLDDTAQWRSHPSVRAAAKTEV